MEQPTLTAPVDGDEEVLIAALVQALLDAGVVAGAADAVSFAYDEAA
ncbi:MAG TPA: hypothetical protein VGE07_18810 [Herpetosiphonaceae bacterium]